VISGTAWLASVWGPKRTVRGPRRPLRGQSPELARQEAWALLLIHNITATAAARAAGSAGLDPGLIPFTAVLGLVRSHVAADTCCRHCGHRPASADAPLASLDAATNQAHRGSHLHHRHHKVESPEMGHNSGNLRAVRMHLMLQLAAMGPPGLDLVIVDGPSAAMSCPMCAPWEGKVLSLGATTTGTAASVTGASGAIVNATVAGTVAEAVGAGLLHPNCRHSLVLFTDGAAVLPFTDGAAVLPVAGGQRGFVHNGSPGIGASTWTPSHPRTRLSSGSGHSNGWFGSGTPGCRSRSPRTPPRRLMLAWPPPRLRSPSTSRPTTCPGGRAGNRRAQGARNPHANWAIWAMFCL
jgi:hypothetical protein